MSLGISKCAKLTIKMGKVVQTGPLPAFSGSEIPGLEIAGLYCYLGFPEGGSIDHKCCKNVVLDEFHSRLRLICTSFLHARFKVQATNAFCVPVLSNGFEIVDWIVAEISQVDITVCKVMVLANSLHPRSAVERLYLPHRLGSRSLLGMENLCHHRLIMLSNHL